MSDERSLAVAAAMAASDSLDIDESVLEVVQLSGGWSRHSFIARTTTRTVIVRVKPKGGFLDTDLEAEHALYIALGKSDVPIPTVLGAEFAADTPFGGPFFVMSHAPGKAPNAFRKRDRAELQADWEGSRQIATEMVENLARIHSVPMSAELSQIPAYGFLDLVERWRADYLGTRLLRDPVFEEAFAWVADRVPLQAEQRLVHGDFRIGNVLLHEGHVTAVLDWELAYRGDPRFDIGYFALEFTAGRHLGPVTDLLGAVADQDWFFEEYERLSGLPVDPEVVRTFSVLGVLMLVGTLYTGIQMYVAGRTTDIRMAWNRFELPVLRDSICRLLQW